MRAKISRRGLRGRVHAMAAGTVALALAATGLSATAAPANPDSPIADLLDLDRPELAAVAEKVAEGDEEGAAEELLVFYSERDDVVYPDPGGGGAGDASADEIAAGTFSYGGETRDFYDEEAGRIDVDWEDTWGGTEDSPGPGQVLMSDFTFLPILTRAYMEAESPERREAYAGAWMEISLDFFTDVPEWPRGRNLSAAKRLDALVSAFSVFRAEPTLDGEDLVAFLQGVRTTADVLTAALRNHGGNNWYMSMARGIYIAGVYLPELTRAYTWEHFAVHSSEWFLRANVKGDHIYREPTFHYQAYVADLINIMISVGEANGRELPPTLPRTADWIADSLFATRMPNLEPALVGDANHARSGHAAIRSSGERNDWEDFTWAASGREEGTMPTQGSAIYPISFAAQRSGWDEDARYLLINNQNTGYTASHRHPDDLSVVMAAYGRPLIVDPGAKDYNRSDPVSEWMRYRTEAHNTVDVDGQDQAAGVSRASWLWRSNDGLDVYRGEAMGYAPVSHDRVVYFVKPGFWIVSDAMTGAQDTHDYRQLWHFPGDPVSVDPETQVATVGFDTVHGEEPVSGVQLVPVAGEAGGVSGVVHDHGAVRLGEDVLTDVDFLSYDWSAGGDTGLDTVVFPGPAGSAPEVSATRVDVGVAHSVATAMEIDLPGGTGTFYLSREGEPSARAFGTAHTDGETAYLERDEAGELVRYALTSGTALSDDGEVLLEATELVSDLSVELAGGAARISGGDPVTGTLSLYAPDVETVLLDDAEVDFTRDGDLITIEVEPDFAPEPVLMEDFAEADLERTVHDFSEGLRGWRAVQGEWAPGGEGDAQLEQPSAADRQSMVVQQDAPDDLHVSAQIVPGDRAHATVRSGLVFRYHDERNYYRAHVLTTREGTTLQLVRIYNGELEVLDEAALGIGADEPHTLRVSATGRHLRASVGETTVAGDDDRLRTGAVGAFTHRRAAVFEDLTVTEAMDQDHWQGVRGEASISGDRLRMAPTDGRAHVLAASTLPARFSQTCDYVVEATVEFDGVGAAGLSLRDTATDAYGYRIHVGRTARGTQYASITREAHRSGPEVLAQASLTNRLDGPVELSASIHGDRITLTVDGEQVLETRDTVVRSGGVGLQVSDTEAYFEDLAVSQACGEEQPASQEPPWDAGTQYDSGDVVTYDGATWRASWWTRNQEPGDPFGPWQEIATADDGAALWTPSRIFTAGDVVHHEGQRYSAQWWTRNQEPGAPGGPWTRQH